MKTFSKSHVARVHRGLFAFSTCALLALAAVAQPAGTDRAGYREQLQACRSGNTYQSREACLEEARAAHAARQRGRLDSYGNHAANALGRCNAYREQEDVLACRARVMGMGGISGSVAGGGLLREYAYEVPASAAPPRASDAASQNEPGRSPSTMGAGPAAEPSLSRLAPDHPAARMVRPPGPVEPLKPVLPTTPAFPMYGK